MNNFFTKIFLCSLIVFGTLQSCIPLRIAPNIKENKVVLAKKFKRSLPRRNAFIFEDPKMSNEFYSYINTKYKLDDVNVQYNVPVVIENENFFLTFYEVEIPNKFINLLPIAADIVLAPKEDENDKYGYKHEPYFEDMYVTRTGNWYVAILVNNEKIEDCLKEGHTSKDKVAKFLENTRKEYLSTQNYLEAYLHQ